MLSGTVVAAVSVFVNLFLNVIKTTNIEKVKLPKPEVDKTKRKLTVFLGGFPFTRDRSPKPKKVKAFIFQLQYYLYSLSQSPILSPEEK